MSDSTAMTKVDVKTAMLLPRLAAAAGLEPAKFYAAVKATCGCEGATDESFAVLLMVADRYQLNPMLKQLYLMKTQKGVQAVIPVDGWVPLLVNHPDYLAHDVTLVWEGEPYKSKCIAATCRIWTKSRQAMGMGPFEHSEMMSECYRETGPWKSHPTRMLGHKSIIQAARWCFGIYVMDAEEAAGIGEMRLTPKPSYTLPTETPANVIEATIVESTGPSEDVKSWRGLIESCKDEQSLTKLHGEFDDVREGRALADVEAIEAAFASRLEALVSK